MLKSKNILMTKAFFKFQKTNLCSQEFANLISKFHKMTYDELRELSEFKKESMFDRIFKLIDDK